VGAWLPKNDVYNQGNTASPDQAKADKSTALFGSLALLVNLHRLQELRVIGREACFALRPTRKGIPTSTPTSSTKPAGPPVLMMGTPTANYSARLEGLS